MASFVGFLVEPVCCSWPSTRRQLWPFSTPSLAVYMIGVHDNHAAASELVAEYRNQDYDGKRDPRHQQNNRTHNYPF
jgi:hypothetical protein